MNSKIIWRELEKRGVKQGECHVYTNIAKNGNINVKHRIEYIGFDPLRKKEIEKIAKQILKSK